MPLDYRTLKVRQRAERDTYPTNLALRVHRALSWLDRAERGNYPSGLTMRVHRALSWLDRAEQCEDDDGCFIFLWFAFNAGILESDGA